MYKVLIADDEQAVRIGMRSFIDWNKNGFELVGEAKDGRAALALIQQTRPDIVITDLKMPEMDGVELIRALNVGGFRGKVLVLSNYNEFDLVRSAMKFGASDYLLKVTMEPEELLSILKQLCEKLKSEKAVLEENNKIKLELNRNREIETRQYFAELINGAVSDDDCDKRQKLWYCYKQQSQTAFLCHYRQLRESNKKRKNQRRQPLFTNAGYRGSGHP